MWLDGRALGFSEHAKADGNGHMIKVPSFAPFGVVSAWACSLTTDVSIVYRTG